MLTKIKVPLILECLVEEVEKYSSVTEFIQKCQPEFGHLGQLQYEKLYPHEWYGRVSTLLYARSHFKKAGFIDFVDFYNKTKTE